MRLLSALTSFFTAISRPALRAREEVVSGLGVYTTAALIMRARYNVFHPEHISYSLISQMRGWWSPRIVRSVPPRRAFRAPSQQPSRTSPDASHSKMSVEYGYIEDVEDPSDYRSGGYHPVQINDRLKERYRVVHKLGHGTFSTAWLAVDEQFSKYVAIKVGTADANKREAEVLSQIASGINPGSPDAEKVKLIPIAEDRFSINGPNGTHPCFVTVPARCSLMDAKEASGRRLFQLDVARSLAAQLVMAISLVHSKGFAHGDLHLGNLLLRMPSSLDSLSVEQLYAVYGKPELEPILRLDGMPTSLEPGVPSHAVLPVWLGVVSDQIKLNEAQLLLSDFGVAFRPSEKSCFESQTPLVIRPPEAFFELSSPLSFASDIWSLGCTIFELLAHRSLIDGILAPSDEITAQQIHLQGRLPPEWWDKWAQRPKWFDEKGKPLSNECDVWDWERRFEQWIQEPRKTRKMDTINDDEKDALLELLKRTLAWRPDERPKADELLEMDWMQEWALPAYGASQKTSA